MNHSEHDLENTEHHHQNNEENCCGAGCCDEEGSTKMLKVGIVLQWLFLGGAFVCSLLTLLFLPKIVRKELMAENALKAGGIENYMKLNQEIYDTPAYRERMKQEVDMFIQSAKAQMQAPAEGQQTDESGMIEAMGSGAEQTGSVGTGQ